MNHYTRLLLLNASLILVLFFVKLRLKDTLLPLPVFLYLDCLCFGLLCQLCLFAQLGFQFCNLLLQRLFRVALVGGRF